MTKLEVLNLTCNNIEDKHINILVSNLKKMKNLTFLNLQGNKITNIDELLEYLPKMKSLDHLVLPASLNTLKTNSSWESAGKNKKFGLYFDSRNCDIVQERDNLTPHTHSDIIKRLDQNDKIWKENVNEKSSLLIQII